MKKSEIIAYFGSQRRLGNAINVRQATISQWPEDAVPGHWQLIIERLTNRKLKATPEAYKDVKDRVCSTTRGLIRLTNQEVAEMTRKLPVKLLLAD
jgi:hypothetical protein